MKSYDLVYTDLVYFGDDSGSLKLEKKFQKELTERFPEAKFNNAYDSIIGYRQEVYLSKENHKDNYYAWVIGNGYFGSSLLVGVMSRQQDKLEYVDSLVEKAKKEYPQNFKKEA